MPRCVSRSRAARPIFRRRARPEEWSEAQHGFAGTCESLGYARVPDLNREGALGVGALPVNLVDGVRVSAAMAWLDRARGRSNLDVRSGVTVDRVTFERGRAAGVR